MKRREHKSKMARRLVRLFVALSATPLIITVVALQRVGREQVVWTARTMERANQGEAQRAGRQFQQLGRDALAQSSEQTKSTSIHAVTSVTRQMMQAQMTSLSQTADEYSRLTSASLDGAMRQSLAAHQAALRDMQGRMTQLFTRSTRETQQVAGGNIERAMQRLNNALMRERARQIATLLQLPLENAPQLLDFVAQTPDVRDPARSEGRKAALTALIRRVPAFLNVAILDPTGRDMVAAAANPQTAPPQYGRHDKAAYFRAGLRGEVYVGRCLPDYAKAPVMQIAVPIRSEQGGVIGVLAARFSLKALWEEIRRVRIGATGYAYVLDENGQPILAPAARKEAVLTATFGVDKLQWTVVVAAPRAEVMEPIRSLKAAVALNSQRALKQMRQDVGQAAQAAASRQQRRSQLIRNAALSQMQARSSRAFDAMQRTTARQNDAARTMLSRAIENQTQETQAISDRQIVLAVQSAARQLEKKALPLTDTALRRADHRLTFLAVLMTLLSCSVGGFLALVTARRIVRPVTRLALAARAIANGELDKRVDEEAPDEIGDLAAAFNMMATSLQQSQLHLNEAEGQLVQSAKLASLGTLSAGVAHELNQPLAIIRGVTQQLQDEPGLSEDVRADLVLIEGQTSRMIKIIRHLRTFCRIGSVELSPVNAHQVVQDCLILVGAQLKAHDVNVVLELEDTPAYVLADPNELEQVFLNLITNARDALEGRAGAQITIRSGREDGLLYLEFRDNGAGIPDAIAARVFDPFFTTKEAGKGTGLGLSISHSIIEKYQGRLHVTNDDGAVFTITLPLAEGEAAAAQAEVNAEMKAAAKTEAEALPRAA